MELEIGAQLAQLRREKGLTQEQLAQTLGVSAPAVSKWETGSSYPDITLLCPLARALGTTVDRLLQFEETLSNQQVEALANEVMRIARTGDVQTAEQRLNEVLHRYPNSVALRFNAALLYDTFQMLNLTAEPEQQAAWRARKRELLEQVRAAGDAAYWQSATLQLANLFLVAGELDRAEALLQELPEQVNADPTTTRALLFLKRDQPDQALQVTQKRLYVLVNQVQACLNFLISPKVTPDPVRALRVWEAFRTMDELFGLSGLAEGLRVELYLRQEAYEQAAGSMARYAEAAVGEAPLLNEALFAPGVNTTAHRPALSREMRQMLLDGLQNLTAPENGESYAPLRELPDYEKALDILRKSLT